MDFTIEELSLNGWPSLQTILLDGWIIRMANGYTKRANSVSVIYSYENDARANSVCAIYPFKNNLEEKINYCEDIYRKNNLPVLFKIIDCDEYKIIDKKLETQNYKKIDLTSIQLCEEIKQTQIVNNISIENYFSNEWKNCLYQCNKITNSESKETMASMLNNIRHDIISVFKMENDVLAGCGYGVIERGFIGLYDIIVKDEFRSRGYGKEIIETILSKAKEKGINKAYLAVVDNNTVAKNLYNKLGFKEIYKYWYRMKE